jgi:hypothetical protein
LPKVTQSSQQKPETKPSAVPTPNT